jgi:hypothetical protein
MDQSTEKRLLQAAMATACIAPVTGGILGMAFGAGMLDYGGDVTLDSQVRYLSGLLPGVGLAFDLAIPLLEKQGARVMLLTVIVIIGGLARLYGAAIDGWPAPTMLFALAMELGVTSLLWLWQCRLARRWED